MKREIVQDFLNLPGIAGLALMDGRSRPYFYGIDRSLNFQQKEALAQGIQQVIETTPVDFEFFQFQFSHYQVYIYKLNHDLILLVLTVANLIDATYTQVTERLRQELQQDVVNTIATFRLLAGNTTLSGQTDEKQGTQTTPSSGTSHPTGSDLLQPLPLTTQPSAAVPPPTAPVPQPAPPVSSSVAAELPVLLKDVLDAMNHLSQYACQYLGPMVVANYWKTTRPPEEWLSQFQIERSAQLLSLDQSVALTPEQHQWIQNWVIAFVNRCAKVIRDFPTTVRQNVLDDRQKSLLFPYLP